MSDAGLPVDSEGDETYEPEHFGDGEVVLHVGVLGFRFTRDRGQEFVELTGPAASGEFFDLADIASAMGWTTDTASLANRTPTQILLDAAGHISELATAMSSCEAIAGIVRARERREAAFLDRLLKSDAGRT